DHYIAVGWGGERLKLVGDHPADVGWGAVLDLADLVHVPGRIHTADQARVAFGGVADLGVAPYPAPSVAHPGRHPGLDGNDLPFGHRVDPVGGDFAPLEA